MKYWYIYFETINIDKETIRSWRIWHGEHPIVRLMDCPDQIPMFWQEIPEEVAKLAINKFGNYPYELDYVLTPSSLGPTYDV